jgi:hypothetical protein
MQNFYTLLVSNIKDEDSKKLYTDMFDAFNEDQMKEFLNYYLTKPFSNKISNQMRAKIASKLVEYLNN